MPTVRAATRRPLYTPDQRRRRDASPWTVVQGVLAPLQFLVCLVSAILVARCLITGEGYGLATASVLAKTAALYAIMVTGAIWEKEVFGRYLLAPAFFWEDVVSFGVITLHTAYVLALAGGWLAPEALLVLALVAYAAYALNAAQFLLKLRAARLDGGASDAARPAPNPRGTSRITNEPDAQRDGGLSQREGFQRRRSALSGQAGPAFRAEGAAGARLGSRRPAAARPAGASA